MVWLQGWLVFLLCVLALVLIILIDGWFTKRRERREQLPPLRGHTWRGDDE